MNRLAHRRHRRRHRAQGPLIVGITGSIAMGKSTTVRMARNLGAAVFDSDATSRRLTAPTGAALPAIAKAFPSAMENGVLDRKALAKIVFDAPQKLKHLEAIIHPLVQRARAAFLRSATRRRCKVVVFDIPLLFETGAQSQCDLVVVVDAPDFLQHQRALARPGMTSSVLAGILARQTPAARKRHMADVVIPSGLGRALTLRRLKKALMFN